MALVPAKRSTADRKEFVKVWSAKGMTDARLAKVAMVSTRTIARDRKELGLPRFSEISDDKVMDLIGDVKESMHTKVGREKIESQCIHRGARVQRRRIRVAQGELGIIQARPGRKERKEYYTSVGPDWTW